LLQLVNIWVEEGFNEKIYNIFEVYVNVLACQKELQSCPTMLNKFL